MKFCRQSARLIATLACIGFAQAEPPSTLPEPQTWRVTVTGYQRPAGTMVSPIPEALKTELAAARETSAGDLVYLNRDDFEALGVDWKTFQAKSAPAASAQLAGLKPEWIRDRNQVVECAILRAARSADDITPVVLAPDFLKRFTPVFGRKILIAIPDRRTIFLFPRLASRYQDYADRVVAIYRKSDVPVSREVLELSATGLRAIGEYE